MSNTGTTKHLEQVREALDEAQKLIVPLGVSHRHLCDSSTLIALAKGQSALSAHEEEDAKREEEVRELVMLSEHALTALRAHGYNIAADHLAEQIAKVKGEKK